jgi:hypothetical protein
LVAYGRDLVRIEIVKRFKIFGLLIVLSACTQAPISMSFQTPEDTFKTWRQAAERLDLETLVTCYSQPMQSSFRKEISANSAEGLKAMQRETQETEFKIEKIVYEDKKAYLRVVRHRGTAAEIEILNMIKEGTDWKLIP